MLTASMRTGKEWQAPSRHGDGPRLNPVMLARIRISTLRRMWTLERLSVLLDLRFDIYCDGSDRWEGFSGWMTEVDGQRLGLPDDLGKRDGQWLHHRYEYNLLVHLQRIVLGEVPVRRRAEALTTLHRQLLQHDGFCPDGVENVARTLGRLRIDAGARRHAFDDHGKISIDLGHGVSVGNGGVIVTHPWPSSIILALPGRRVGAVIEHPVLQNFVIERVNVRAKSFTLVVSHVETDRAA